MTNYIFERYEKKYLIKKEQLDILISKLLNHIDYDEYCKEGKKYCIYNIYYDTINSDIIRKCTLYPSYKEKLRIRTYDVPNSNEDFIFLEIKRKYDGKTSKRRIKLTLLEANDLIINKIKPQRESYLNKQIIEEIYYYVKNNDLKPMIFLSYERLAFSGDDGLRITFDNNLITRRENVSLFNTSGNNLLSKDQYIMEIKIPRSIPLWLAEILSELKIYSQGFSKYGYDYKLHTKEVRTNV